MDEPPHYQPSPLPHKYSKSPNILTKSPLINNMDAIILLLHKTNVALTSSSLHNADSAIKSDKASQS